MYVERQLRLRVLEALERHVKQFKIREDLWPLRVPHEPLSLDEVLERTLPDGARGFDIMSLRSRTLLRLEWDDDSAWEAWVIVLPSKIKLFCDTSHEESRVLASGGRNEGDESDRIFLELLSNSAGHDFGIEMAGGPPARVRSSLPDREFVIDVFVNLFEVAQMERDIRRELTRLDPSGGGGTAAGHGRDFRADVARWLEIVRR
jgi:hypothetical protein